MRHVAIAVTAFSILLPITVFAGSSPHLKLQLGVRAEVDGNLEQGIHLLDLNCWGEGCSLTTISLNQCSTIGTSEPTFSIGVERITTESGAMIVRPEKNALVVRQSAADIGGEASVWFRFEFDPPFQTKTTKFPTGFSGGYAKHSSLLGKIVTGKFVPFEGLMSVVSLDCPLLVPGLRSLPSSLQNQVAE